MPFSGISNVDQQGQNLGTLKPRHGFCWDQYSSLLRKGVVASVSTVVLIWGQGEVAFGAEASLSL